MKGQLYRRLTVIILFNYNDNAKSMELMALNKKLHYTTPRAYSYHDNSWSMPIQLAFKSGTVDFSSTSGWFTISQGNALAIQSSAVTIVSIIHPSSGN